VVWCHILNQPEPEVRLWLTVDPDGPWKMFNYQSAESSEEALKILSMSPTAAYGKESEVSKVCRTSSLGVSERLVCKHVLDGGACQPPVIMVNVRPSDDHACMLPIPAPAHTRNLTL